ncbi:MAG: HD family phosphohydrolase [Aureispira sp.]
MRLKFLKRSIKTLPYLTRFTLLGGLVLFISLFFPNRLEFDYDFEQGERWRHHDIKAPFDFPIKKTDGEMAKERAIIAAEVIPYYRLDKTLEATQQERFRTVFNASWNNSGSVDSSHLEDSSRYLKFGRDVIDEIYTTRLIQLEQEAIEKGEDFVFQLLDGNVDLGEHTLEDVYTEKQAIQWLVDTLHQVENRLPEFKFLFNVLEKTIDAPNIALDSSMTAKKLQAAYNSISPYRGMVKAGEAIVMRDRLIDSVAYAKIVSYQDKYNQEINQHKNSVLIYLGYLTLTIVLIAIFALFVQFYSPKVFKNWRHLLLVVLLIAAYTYLADVVNNIHILDLYLIPFCIIPIIIINFFNPQLALVTHLITILLVSMLLSLDYHFILTQTLVGMVAVITKLKTRYLSNFFISLLYIGMAYCVAFLSLEIIHAGTIFPVVTENGTIVEEGVRWHMLRWLSFNIFLTLLSYPLIPLIEKVFGLTSDITLVELSDLDKPLLKKLSIKAPGTLQHSLQVANLSEAAAKAIGANALLVKVASLYHDIGKMHQPHYYIENQNDINPHDQLSHLESAKIIIQHITEGVRLAKKHRLPGVLIDFIWTHHGTTRVEFFYRMHKKEHPDQEVDPALFTYPGPKPSTKEQAIMMIADSLEAASKSLKSPTEEDINNLVENIIKGKIANGQLQHTNLSFKELEKIKVVFKKLLKSMNHVRIVYPEDSK